MQKKRSIKIIALVLIIVLICLLITYSKNDGKVVLATTKEFNSENLQDNEHMHVELDSSGDKVPVPNGYVGSKVAGENEIDTGYVIYEGEEEVTDENVEEAQKTRNQYVWILVPDATTMYGTDANGKKWGKLYEFTTSTGNNIDPVTGAKPLNWSENNGVMQIINRNSYKEPAIIYYQDKNSFDMNSQLSKINEKSSHEFLIHLEQEFNNMIESIEKYGGFYIGRYETGNIGVKKAVIQKNNSNIHSQTWYTMYKKCKDLQGNNNYIETGMIWGCQYDRTLIWLIESKDKTKDEIINSDSWSTGKKQATGSSEVSKANNIYDLAGNVEEWIMEGGSTRRTTRGTNNAKDRSSIQTPLAINDSIGCRAMLYIK